MSIHTTLNCPLKPTNLTSLKVFLEKNLANVRSFKGCRHVQVFFNLEGNEMLLEEEWDTKQQHQTYLKYIEENGVLAELSTFLEMPPCIKYFTKELL